MDGATLPLSLPISPLPISPLPCRDRFLEPFSSASIWNTAIGSAAQFSAAHLFNDTSNLPSQFHNDQVSPGVCAASVHRVSHMDLCRDHDNSVDSAVSLCVLVRVCVCVVY